MYPNLRNVLKKDVHTEICDLMDADSSSALVFSLILIFILSSFPHADIF
jgi:hypothetical protein